MQDAKPQTIFGIGWPGDRPGYACVLELTGDIIKLQHEIEGDTLADLIAKCARFKKDHHESYPIRGYVGRRINAEMAFIKEHNRNTMNEFIVFAEAPCIEPTGRIYYHMNMILDVLRNDNKKLYLLDNCRVLATLKSIQSTNNLQDISDRDYPDIAALGYGVAYLSNRMRAKRRKQSRRRANPITV